MWREVAIRPIMVKEAGSGSATLFVWEGSAKKGWPQFAVKAYVPGAPDGFMLGSSGYVGDAVKKAFRPLQGTRLGSANQHYLDLGAPLGKPSDLDSMSQTEVVLTFNVPGGRMATILREEGILK